MVSCLRCFARKFLVCAPSTCFPGKSASPAFLNVVSSSAPQRKLMQDSGLVPPGSDDDLPGEEPKRRRGRPASKESKRKKGKGTGPTQHPHSRRYRVCIVIRLGFTWRRCWFSVFACVSPCVIK